ncbi:hypothetical protein [Streptomyces sp. NBC_00286]|uniref:hypothetical protein n=1 Tax=Streptomyces sp. NBC_00286 TaxID=2975701 RepID=UPI002E29F53F|nr:hypothetical protein [Streptomyces sp. NBC_00286]
MYVPALCLAAADGLRKGPAEHTGALPAAEIVELDFAGASTVGALLRDGVEWRLGHAVHLSRPTPDWPDGRHVVTADPGPVRGHASRTRHQGAGATVTWAG